MHPASALVANPLSRAIRSGLCNASPLPSRESLLLHHVDRHDAPFQMPFFPTSRSDRAWTLISGNGRVVCQVDKCWSRFLSGIAARNAARGLRLSLMTSPPSLRQTSCTSIPIRPRVAASTWGPSRPTTTTRLTGSRWWSISMTTRPWIGTPGDRGLSGIEGYMCAGSATLACAYRSLKQHWLTIPSRSSHAKLTIVRTRSSGEIG